MEAKTGRASPRYAERLASRYSERWRSVALAIALLLAGCLMLIIGLSVGFTDPDAHGESETGQDLQLDSQTHINFLIEYLGSAGLVLLSLGTLVWVPG